MKMDFIKKLQCLLFITLQFCFIYGQENLSQGPYKQLILRNTTLINGNGAPPIGPVDIEIRNNVITKIKTVGSPGVAKKK